MQALTFGEPDYVILTEDTVVATVNNGVVNIINRQLCPLYFIYQNTSFENWLLTRTPDTSRSSIRLICRKFGVNLSEIESLVRKNRCMIVTDNYWFKETSDDNTYRYYRNKFGNSLLYELASTNRGEIFDDEGIELSAEFTSIGSFNKGWRFDEQTRLWWMSKYGDIFNTFSELFVFNLCKALNFDVARYVYRSDNYVDTLNFVKSTQNFEHARNIVGEDENPKTFIKFLDSQGLLDKMLNLYLDILFVDSIVRNPDRHTENFGMFRDKVTGIITGMGPNYDNNLSLLGNINVNKIPEKHNDILIKEFRELKETYNYVVPHIDRQLLYSCIPFGINEKGQYVEDSKIVINQKLTDDLIEFIMEGYYNIR